MHNSPGRQNNTNDSSVSRSDDPASDAQRGRRYPDMVHTVLGPLIPAGSSVALFDFPNYSNVGDSAIWLGEEHYLRTKINAHILTVDDHRLVERELPKLPEGTIILIQGGGNFGDLYPRHQELRRKIVAKYVRHRVIQLPQSIHYQNSQNKEICRKAFNEHDDFHLIVRDRPSLEIARQLHDGPIYLCPDMALCLGEVARTTTPVHSIVGLLRTDREKVTADASPVPDDKGIYATDWVDEPITLARKATTLVERIQDRCSRKAGVLYDLKCRLYHALAQERFRRGCGILGSGQVVITDRLHGHIMCCLLGIPHVVLDNSYRKIGNFRDAWGTGEGLCVSADTLSGAYGKALDRLAEMRST